MNENEVRDHVSYLERLFRSYEWLLRISDRVYPCGEQVARALCKLYAMMTAFQIWDAVGEFPVSGDNSPVLSDRTPSRHAGNISLPTHSAVKLGSERVIHALGARDQALVTSILAEMGVQALCSDRERHFAMMDSVILEFSGAAKVIPLLELALFWILNGNYERVRSYSHKARAFVPRSWELYTLCIVDGLIALKTDDLPEAAWQLEQAVCALRDDGDASLISSYTGPNLILAQRLLERGDRHEVSRHLVQCREIWQLYPRPFDEWISAIGNGDTPDLLSPESLAGMNLPSFRLKVQWMRACSLTEGHR